MITIYGIEPYDRSAKARWLLTEMGVPFENRWLDRKKNERESPEYLKINPMGTVPLLQVGEQYLFESGAICAYLADHFPEKDMAPAVSSPKRASYQQWMYFASVTLDTAQVRIMVIEDIPAGEVQKKKETQLQADLQDACEALDRTLSHSSYLVGNKFTAADICISYHLYWCKLWPELNGVISRFHHVEAYLERMKNRPAALKAQVFSYEG